ncbi:hypothetical protein L6164_000168 [Bauhinia variegata]|uniref:Uncharacterized protein n=1 Tax=Bauhinia variegata TaxID=167791 RepID=A0ACB9Q5T2_BAUVA|nr:hypothetical protein L6164_000168 [Bauhinia variegata]
MASLKVAMVLLICMAVMAAPITLAAISCGQVSSALAPCIKYLTSTAPLAPPCCAGVKSVAAAAQTPADKQAACNCMKSAAGQISNLNPDKAASLPGKCGVNIPYKISTSTNCATIKF